MKAFRFKNFQITQNKVLFVLWLFLLVFPKGGIKINGVPLTWGYVFLGIATLASFFKKQFKISPNRINTLYLIIPFQIITLTSITIKELTNYPLAIAFIVSFYFLPWTFIFFLSQSIEEIKLTHMLNLIRKGINFISIYGIFLFFIKIFSGEIIEIPLITTNLHDYGMMDLKNIKRGDFFKLISTYNNGNIYGICLLMLLPLYNFLEKSNWKKFFVVMSLFLTLSRTVWIGLFLFPFLDAFLKNKKNLQDFLKLGIKISLALFSFLAIIFYFGIDFILDKNLGGRINQINEIEEIQFFPLHPFFDITEIVYLSILSNFGILGLVSFLTYMCSPIFFSLSNTLNDFQRKIVCGLLLFLIIACSDGAICFIPVMAFYWFLSSFLLRKNWDLQQTDLSNQIRTFSKKTERYVTP